MKIVLFLDYSSFTEKVLESVSSITQSFADAEISVVHIIDEQLFYPTSGFEVALGETMHNESEELKEMCILYLGEGIGYIEEFGIPKLIAEEKLKELNFDLLIAGSHSRHGLGSRILGSFAEHILRVSKKPVLIIP